MRGEPGRSCTPRGSRAGDAHPVAGRRSRPIPPEPAPAASGFGALQAWCAVAARAVYFSVRSASPRVSRFLSSLLARAGRAGLVTASVAAAAFPLVVAGIRIGHGVAERGRYLYYPPHWDSGWSPAAVSGQGALPGEASDLGVGGIADAVLPLRVMAYTAKPGDTFSGIARDFGLELDTVSSLNRTWGNGVHTVSIGERIRVPNQNGITLTIRGTLEDVCRQYDVLPETVLAANGVRAADVAAGSVLFFPGVQHRGAEKELVAGTAFFIPVAGWVSSSYGYRGGSLRLGPAQGALRRRSGRAARHAGTCCPLRNGVGSPARTRCSAGRCSSGTTSASAPSTPTSTASR